MEGMFHINIDKSYANILSCCKRFLKFIGIKFDFKPTKGLNKIQMIVELIHYFETKIEPLGLTFIVSKKGRKGTEIDVLQCIVYRCGKELDDTIVILYCAPARYLSPAGCQMYKRFMKFVSNSTNIPLGIPKHTDNFYLDGIINFYEDEDFYIYGDEENEEKEFLPVIEKYKQDGEFWKLFNEIKRLPNEKTEDLYKALKEYLNQCPVKETEVVDAMIDGINIVKDANCYWFNFNPDDDGFPDEYDQYCCNEYSSSVLSSAILFSEHDGISDALIDSINNEVNSGVTMSGWNIHQYLSPKMRKEDILEFMRCKDLCASLSKWLIKFYRATEKFDLYGKLNQDT